MNSNAIRQDNVLLKLGYVMETLIARMEQMKMKQHVVSILNIYYLLSVLELGQVPREKHL